MDTLHHVLAEYYLIIALFLSLPVFLTLRIKYVYDSAYAQLIKMYELVSLFDIPSPILPVPEIKTIKSPVSASVVIPYAFLLFFQLEQDNLSASMVVVLMFLVTLLVSSFVFFVTTRSMDRVRFLTQEVNEIVLRKQLHVNYKP